MVEAPKTFPRKNDDYMFEESMEEIPRNKKEILSKKEKIAPVLKEKKSITELWTEKYNPINAKSILGNQSIVASLREWLERW